MYHRTGVKSISFVPSIGREQIPPPLEPFHESDIEQETIKNMMGDLSRIADERKDMCRVVYDTSNTNRNSDWMPNDLKFDSSFESGNCAKVIFISDIEYDIITSQDINCVSHTQVQN